MLSTTHLEFAYNEDSRFFFPDIYCDKDTPVLLKGRSGSGKTTLLHLLAGLLRPQQGQISIDNTDVLKLGDKALDRFRGKHIGIVFQRSHFLASLTVRDNMLLSPYLSGNKIDVGKAIALASQLGIGNLLAKRPSEISQGEMQRVSIARALLNDPHLLLADEPTSSLDDENCEKVIRLLQTQSTQAGVALVVVSHDERLKRHFSNIISLT